MKIHLCLVSDQPIPNLLPVVNMATRPDKVVLAVTADMQRKRKDKYLKKVLGNYVKDIEELQIEDPYDIQKCCKIFVEWLLKQIKANPGAEICLNTTGGTKPMSLGAVSAFWSDTDVDRKVFYVDRNRLIYFNNEIEVVNLENKLTLSDIIGLHGGTINYEEPEVKWEKFSDTMFSEPRKWAVALSTLNRYATGAANDPEGVYEVDLEKVPKNWNKMIDLLCENGIIVNDESCQFIQFSSEEARRFANGGWIEQKVFSIAQSLQEDISDIKMNVMVSRGNNINELDIAGVYKNSLLIIECKTQRFSTDDQDKDPINQAIYKLNYLKDPANGLGGLKTIAILVSFLPVPPHAKERARKNGMILFDQKDIPNLKHRLQEELSKK